MGTLSLNMLVPSIVVTFCALSLMHCDTQDPAFNEERRSDARSPNGIGNSGDLVPESDDNPHWVDVGEGGGNGAGEDGSGGEGGDGNGVGGLGGGIEGLVNGVEGGTDGGSDGGGGDGGDGGSGEGGEGGTSFNFVSQELTQKGPGKVDILWIVDGSGSMAEEQNYLGNNFNAFITELENSGHDFQLAVTSTDVCRDSQPSQLKDRRCPTNYGGGNHHRGSFIGPSGEQVLNANTQGLAAKFTSYVNVGVNGSGFEHGLTAAQLAIEKVANGSNDDLTRDGAFLAVIVVSDEEDDGIGLSKMDAYNGNNFAALGLTEYRYTEDNLISYLQSVIGAGKFSVSAITGTRESNGELCSAPHSQIREEGTQYIKAANKTGGIVQSICETNWSDSLADIGLDINAQVTQVPLENNPDVATIKVYVNGTKSTEWSYNSGNNAVKFNSDAIPVEGDTIKVTYYKL